MGSHNLSTTSLCQISYTTKILHANRMDKSFLLFCVISMSLFSTENAAFNSSSDDLHDSDNLLPLEDVVPDTIQKEQEKHIEDHPNEDERETKETLINDVTEVKKKGDERESFTKTEEELCRGEIKLSEGIQKKLKCRYIDHGISSLKIAPFKVEEVHLDPRIVIYHNVIYNEEIETFKRLSKPLLKAATTRNSTSGIQRTSTYRIAQNAWIKDKEHAHVQDLTRRVEHMTGLTADTAEDLQIAYYSIGGRYQTHKDFYGDVRYFPVDNGNRISTVLFYMNDVKEGGATIFPQLNVTIWPRKGSAAFWYNLDQNGEGDFSTLHAACTVLSGTKWIATKWLHEKGQEFLKPCTLLGNQLRLQ